MTLTQKIKRFDWRSALIAAPFAVMLAWLVTSILDRDAPVDFLSASAVEKSAPAGGTIEIHFDVYRHRICPVIKTARTLIDSASQEHAVSNFTFSSNTRPGRESYDRTITVPEAAAIGTASYQIRINYACNVIHNLGWPIVVQSPRVFFRVTPSETQGLNLPALPPH
ncbi:hypothetical protein FJ872_19300 [Mesorhizobium sp. B2-5-9]|uniref:hypothetical protein n=1 Tax=Mesorhizobium sp. B2-5-9 TaxID=2589921 RepID=UPI00112BAA16|nr:hypothetical protein [Mesorhizobium sp. B2-5-9]TPK15147.1 hypothetical protein FJ872_19300 [Mesorhizobium sp. B2-5-9]